MTASVTNTGVSTPGGEDAPVGTAVFVLPDSIPDGWVTQIREAVKSDRPSVVWSLMGSSVLGAVIAAGSAFGTAYINSRANIQSEVERESRAAAKEKLTSYVALDQNLNDFRDSYNGLITLVKSYQSKQQLKDKDTIAFVRTQLNNLGVKERVLIDVKRDVNIDQGVIEAIDKPIASITGAMVAADADLGNFLQNTDLINMQLADAIKVDRDAMGSLKSKIYGAAL